MHAYLLPCLNSGPLAIERMIAAIAPGEYDRALEPGRFTPREIVAHLADWEPILRARIRQAVESPGSTIEPHDEDQMAVDHGYASADVHDKVELYKAERRLTAEYACSLTRAELAHLVTHPERGEQSAEDLVGMLLGHDMYHVEQLSAYLGEAFVPSL